MSEHEENDDLKRKVDEAIKQIEREAKENTDDPKMRYNFGLLRAVEIIKEHL